ncbi:uncharacterized protein LOC144017367 [Festucalex cinctus]
MGRHFIITIHVLLFAHSFYFASLQNVTDSPADMLTGDPSWLRQPDLVGEEETENGQEGDVSGMETNNNFSGVIFNEDNNVGSLEPRENEASDDLDVAITTESPTSPNASMAQPELPDGGNNITNIKNEAGLINSTTPPAIPDADLPDQSTTIAPDSSNHSDIGNTTTLAPDIHDLNENTTTTTATTTSTTATTTTSTSGNDTKPTNVTESNNTTVATTSATAEMNTTSATSSSANPLPPEPISVTTVAPETPEGNLTDKQASSGSSSDRGLSSETSNSRRNEAWGAVLGTAVVVSIVGLVAYIILKRRHVKGFSHRKLVEEFPSDPVLRLDNSEPLDLNFGRSAYYNPGLQGDNIQMANIPARQAK